MSANVFGNLFQVMTFGESHGPGLGAVIDGCPAGVAFDSELLTQNLRRRRPGQSAITTSRREEDHPEILSGVFEGKTLGTPIAIVVRNKNQDSAAYTSEVLKTRPGHATDLWQSKFGHSDPRGSGRASGRETLSRVLGGSVAQMVLQNLFPELKVLGFVSQVGDQALSKDEVLKISAAGLRGEILVDDFQTRIPNVKLDSAVTSVLLKAKEEGESYGGLIDIFASGVPAHLGQPVFKKLKSEMSSAFMSVGAVNSVEVGFAHEFRILNGTKFHGDASSYGGLRGGISTGENLHFRVGFKPPATLGENAKKGRHDPCILPRAVPVLEAMAHMVLLDQVLWSRRDRL